MKTAMQELREDLQLTIDTAKDALLEIENEGIRLACQEVVRLTLKNIIKRIDNELLEMEKNQLEDYAEYYLAVGNPKTPSEYFKNK